MNTFFLFPFWNAKLNARDAYPNYLLCTLKEKEQQNNPQPSIEMTIEYVKVCWSVSYL